jgi:hypothetical protein
MSVGAYSRDIPEAERVFTTETRRHGVEERERGGEGEEAE